MQLNNKITLQSNYKEESDYNQVLIDTDIKLKVMEVLTTLELAKNILTEQIEIAAKRDEVTTENFYDWLNKITLEELYATKEK